MTQKEYLTQKFASVGLTLTDVDIEDMNICPEEQVTDTLDLQRLFIEQIPTLLLRPGWVSEGGVSISKANKEDIITFYAAECERLGIVDKITKKPKVRFI